MPLLLLVADDGELEASGMLEMPSHVGWLQQHPTNGHLYCVSGANVCGMKIAPNGSLSAPFTTADAQAGSAYLDITDDGKWALSASYGDSKLSIMPIADDGAVSYTHHPPPQLDFHGWF